MMKAIDEVAQSPEGKAAVERNQRKMDVVEVACTVAASGLDDNAACAELRARLLASSGPARDAVEHLAALRTTYVDDRAYRLLTAAIDDAPVRPIDPAVRDQFAAEAKLGRMSLTDAFEYLVSLEPRLRARPPADRRSRRGGFSFESSEPPLVGPWAVSHNAVVNTELAADVVREYWALTRSGCSPEPDSTPFFERKRRTFGGSVVLFGREDTRPRAQN